MNKAGKFKEKRGAQYFGENKGKESNYFLDERLVLVCDSWFALGVVTKD
jgi:hypothetical protein